jgi:hypothetical protein
MIKLIFFILFESENKNLQEKQLKQQIKMQQQQEEIKVNFSEKQSGRSENVFIFFRDCDEFLSIKNDQLNQELKNKIQDYFFDVKDQRISDTLIVNDKYIILDSFNEIMKLDCVSVGKKIDLIKSYTNTQMLRIILQNKFNKSKGIEYFNSRNIFERNKVNFYVNLNEDSSKNECSSLINKINIDDDIITKCKIEDLASSLPGSLYILKNRELMEKMNETDRDNFLESLSEIERTMNIDIDTLLEGETLERMNNFLKLHPRLPLHANNYNILYRVDSSTPGIHCEIKNINEKMKEEIIKLFGEKLYDSFDWNTVYFTGGTLLNIIQKVFFGRTQQHPEKQDIDIFINKNKFKRIIPVGFNVVFYPNNIKFLSPELTVDCHLTTWDNVKIINNFEFGFQRCFWHNHKLYMTPMCLLSLDRQVNFQYSEMRQIKFELMSKYIERGYKFILNDVEMQSMNNKDPKKEFTCYKCVSN